MYTRIIFSYLVTANIGLVLFNLIPAYPLDGGRMLRVGLSMALGVKRADPLMLWLSWALALGLGVYGALQREWLLVIVAALVFLAAGGLNERFRMWLNRGYGHLFDRGLVALQKGDYHAAIAYYDRAIARHPQRALSYNNRGAAYHNKQDYGRALADYTHAIELNPDHALAFSNRARAYFDMGENERALAAYNRAIELAPERAEVYLGRGRSYQQQGEHDLAAADFRRVLELNAKPDVRRKAEALLRELAVASV